MNIGQRNRRFRLILRSRSLNTQAVGRSEREFFIALLQETTTTMKDLADLAPRDRKRVVS